MSRKDLRLIGDVMLGKLNTRIKLLELLLDVLFEVSHLIG